MAGKIDFSLLDNMSFSIREDKKANLSVNEEEKNSVEILDIDEQPSQEINSDEFTLGVEFEKNEEVHAKKEFEGVNKAVLEVKDKKEDSDIQIANDDNDNNSVDDIYDHVNQLLEEEIHKESKVALNNEEQLQSIDGRKIKVICIGGNETYYKNVFNSITASCPDIEFIKYISNAGNTAFYTIDTTDPDIIVIYHKAQIKNALQFLQTIQTEADDKGIPYAQKYAEKRLVVLAPNDFAYEIDLRRYGVSFVVKEINPKTHEIDIKDLVEQIRSAARDIVNEKNKKEAVRQAQEDLKNTYVNNADDEEAETVEKPIEDVDETDVEIETVELDLNNEKKTAEEPIAEEVQTPQQVAPPPPPHAVRQFDKVNFDLNSDEGKILCVYSATGGAGSTTFATNLAAILAKYSNIDNPESLKVALIEYNLSCQCIDLFFNIKSEDNIGLLAREVAGYINDRKEVEIPVDEMRSIISKHMYKEPETGLDILFGIKVPLEIDRIGPGFTRHLFKALKSMYDVVIVDMSADIAKTPILEAFNDADEIYYIMPMDVVSIRNTRALVRFFANMFNFSNEKLKVILNKVNVNNKEFDVQQVYSALANDNCIPEGTIPFAGDDILSSINRGIPISLENLEHPVSQAIYSIAIGINPMLNDSLITNIEAENSNSGGFLSKLFGGSKKEKNSERKAKSRGGFFHRKKNEEPVNEPIETPKKRGGFFSRNKNEEEEAPKKRGGFFSRHRNVEEEPEIEVKPRKRGGFFSRNKEIAENSVDVPPEVLQEATSMEQPKQGFFSRLFSRGKKEKASEPQVVVSAQPRTRLKSIGNRPRRR